MSGIILGKVYDAKTGNLIPNPIVNISGATNGNIQSLVESGYAYFAPTNGDYLLTAEADGYTPLSPPLKIKVGSKFEIERDITLHPET